MTQNGTLQVIKVGSTNSVAVFAGAFTGSGGSSGGGDIFFLGDLRPGNSPASVTFGNNVAFGSSATLNVEIGGTTQGTGYDHLNITGDLTLDGVLDVALINGFIPIAGQSFNILDWLGTRTGTFSSLDLPTLAGSGVEYLAALHHRRAQRRHLPATSTTTATVDAADYVVWRKTDGTPDRLQPCAHPLRPNGRQRLQYRGERRRPRAVDAGDASSGGCGRVFTSTPGRIESPENSSTRETGQQLTPFLTHIYSVEKSSIFSDGGALAIPCLRLRHQPKEFGTCLINCHFVLRRVASMPRSVVVRPACQRLAQMTHVGSSLSTWEREPLSFQTPDNTCIIMKAAC